jgi:hypothetical protein
MEWFSSYSFDENDVPQIPSEGGNQPCWQPGLRLRASSADSHNWLRAEVAWGLRRPALDASVSWHLPRMPATMTIPDDPFVAPCALLTLPAQYQRAEPQQDSYPASEVGFSCGCSGRGL